LMYFTFISLFAASRLAVIFLILFFRCATSCSEVMWSYRSDVTIARESIRWFWRFCTHSSKSLCFIFC
jgi:hypothetical protein